jgi:DHA3 family macrolide efflux protein-like MFS transporter
MGGLMAASLLPRILVSPVAGVVVDRRDRRQLLIWMDVIRGAAVVLVAVEALLGMLQVWMVFAAGIVIGLCGAFFFPAVTSVIPDIIGKTKIVQANSVFSMLQAGGSIIGNSAGGALFQAIGAPFLFLFNGISFLFSAANLVFAKVPRIHHEAEKPHVLVDLANGISFVWNFRGLRMLVLFAGVINFFANMAMVLFLPFFQKNPALGPARFGIAMAFFTGGMLVGMLFTSVVKIPPARRFFNFVLFGAVTFVLMAAYPFIPVFPLAVAMLAVSGFANSIVNVFIIATMQLTVPQNMRGKVFALMGMILQGLTPLAFALGGVIAEFLPIPLIMSGSWLLAFAVSIPMLFSPSFRRFIRFDPDNDTLESVR